MKSFDYNTMVCAHISPQKRIYQYYQSARRYKVRKCVTLIKTQSTTHKRSSYTVDFQVQSHSLVYRVWLKSKHSMTCQFGINCSDKCKVIPHLFSASLLIPIFHDLSLLHTLHKLTENARGSKEHHNTTHL